METDEDVVGEFVGTDVGATDGVGAVPEVGIVGPGVGNVVGAGVGAGTGVVVAIEGIGVGVVVGAAVVVVGAGVTTALQSAPV